MIESHASKTEKRRSRLAGRAVWCIEKRQSFERCGFRAANGELDRLADKREYRLVGDRWT